MERVYGVHQGPPRLTGQIGCSWGKSSLLSSNPSTTINTTAMECQICATLEAIRCDRIMKYVRLLEQMKRSKQSTAKLQALSNLRSEADEAWKRLAAHRREHEFGLEPGSAQKCQNCGAEMVLSNHGLAICEHCAGDLGAERKPSQREKSELKKAATAG